MTTNIKTDTSEKITDMSRDDLKKLIREVMQEFVLEIEQLLPDPDAGLEVNPEVAEHLAKSRDERGPYHNLVSVRKELGLDD